MKILITGGAGTLGSNVIERLNANQEVELICIDNFKTGKRSNLSFFQEENIFEGSITDKLFLEKIFKDFSPDVVIHSAASYDDPDDFHRDADVNILGSINLVTLCKKYKVKKVINFQTALCYGSPTEIPVPIDHLLKPFTSYGLSKTFGEAYMLNMGLPLISLRLSNICSKNLSIGPIPTFYKRIKEGKSCFCSDSIRDFLDFDDFFELLEIILFKSDELGIFNVSTGEGKSILEIFNVVKDYLQKPHLEAPVKSVNDDDVAKMVLDPTLTFKTFGWKSKTSFEKTIQKQLEYYDETGIIEIYSHLKS
tara:strand:+ start:13999 stop:14922 length:924 start_codon:yes stop_codon:yes gene_type:complete